METSVGMNTAPEGVTDNTCSISLLDSFDSMYYELAAFADVHNFSLVPKAQTSVAQDKTANQLIVNPNLSMFQLPKRKFPTFSGNLTERQGFDNLFRSILSHAPDLPDVERFEYLKTSLEGEALSLISNLALTSFNYTSAWEILRMRYGNKRDLARMHLDALLTPCEINGEDASSIKTAINKILEHTAALDNLQFVTRQWSPILIHIFEKYFDYNLRARWEQVVGEKYNPQLTKFVDFLRSHIRSAEVHSVYNPSSSVSPKCQKIPYVSKSKSFPVVHKKVLAATTSQVPKFTCPLCKKSHSIRRCELFSTQSLNERFKVVKTHQLCINCLGPGHSLAACLSKYKCQTCNRAHHTMLHFNSLSCPPEVSTIMPGDPPSVGVNVSVLVLKSQPKVVILLSTARLEVRGRDGSVYSLLALLDSGSQASFITDEAASRLMLQRHRASVNVTTFASPTSTLLKGKSIITITPCGKLSPSFNLETFIVPSITGQTPQTLIVPGVWSHIRTLPLADPSYYSPSPIDLLLGADILPSLLLCGKFSGQSGEPMAIETVFGWVLIGPVNPHTPTNITSLCVSVSEPLDETLKRFWEIEELSGPRHLSSADIVAENFYKSTTTRQSDGRFLVKLPFKSPLPLLGDSRTVALQRLKALEVRFSRNDDLNRQYKEFMHDYLTAGHMDHVSFESRETLYTYYIPHHCVLRLDSTTTKLHVIFNASAHTSAGTSLNESMYVGPKLQPDIQAVLLRARLWKYLFLADIKQMYRQILVHPDDRDYQRILTIGLGVGAPK